MAEIRINTAEVSNVGGQFSSKANELRSLIQQARSMMSNLQSGFTGNRATKIFGEWESMQKGLDGAAASLDQAATFLKNAATDFATADGN
jgi:WXG100 family type VII secretion target